MTGSYFDSENIRVYDVFEYILRKNMQAYNI